MKSSTFKPTNWFERFICVFFICAGSCLASAQTYIKNWDHTFGGSSRDWNCSTFKSPSGSIFIIGDSQTDADGDKTSNVCGSPAENSDIWLLKTDAAGSILWQRSYGGDGDERFPQLVFTNSPNGEMLMVCHSSSDISCDKTEPNRDTVPIISNDYWICLLDSNGALLWEKTYGGDGYDEYVRAVQLVSGEFLVCGESKSLAGYDKSFPNYSISNDYWAIKLDAAGNKLWDRVYGGNNGEFLTGMVAEADGGFTLCGSTNSDAGFEVSQNSQGNFDFWIIRFDANGDKVWDRRFGGTGPEKCNSMTKTNDNGYLLTGFTVSPLSGDVSQAPKGLQDYWVVRIDSVGNKLWDQRYGGSAGSFGTHCTRSIAGRFWISGYTTSSATGDVSEQSFGGSDYWSLLVDASGSKIWDKRWGGSNNELNPMITALNDSVLIILGQSDSGGSIVKTATSKGWIDYWGVGFTYSDSALSLPDATNAIISLNAYPNPAKGFCRVELPAGFVINNYQLLDNLGRVVSKHEHASSINRIELSIKDLSPGIYVLWMFEDHQLRSVSKIVVE